MYWQYASDKDGKLITQSTKKLRDQISINSSSKLWKMILKKQKFQNTILLHVDNINYKNIHLHRIWIDKSISVVLLKESKTDLYWVQTKEGRFYCLILRVLIVDLSSVWSQCIVTIFFCMIALFSKFRMVNILRIDGISTGNIYSWLEILMYKLNKLVTVNNQITKQKWKSLA